MALSRKLVNDEQPIRALVAEAGALAERVSWAVDLTTVYASLLLMVLADAGTSVSYLAGRAVCQASGTYRGGEAKTRRQRRMVIADQSRMRGTDLPVLHPHDDLISELRRNGTPARCLLARYDDTDDFVGPVGAAVKGGADRKTGPARPNNPEMGCQTSDH